MIELGETTIVSGKVMQRQEKKSFRYRNSTRFCTMVRECDEIQLFRETTIVSGKVMQHQEKKSFRYRNSTRFRTMARECDEIQLFRQVIRSGSFKLSPKSCRRQCRAAQTYDANVLEKLRSQSGEDCIDYRKMDRQRHRNMTTIISMPNTVMKYPDLKKLTKDRWLVLHPNNGLMDFTQQKRCAKDSDENFSSNREEWPCFTF